MDDEALTHKIIGCAMKVHRILGCGFQEVIYQRALAIEMKNQALHYQREMEMDIFYEGVRIGKRRVDFFVEGEIMVELKALVKLEGANLFQVVNYCQLYNLPSGLLFNFGARSLEFKRVYNLNLKKKNSNVNGAHRTMNHNPMIP